MKRSIHLILLGMLLFMVLPCQAQEVEGSSLYLLVIDKQEADTTYFKLSDYPVVTFSEDTYTVNVCSTASVSFPMSTTWYKVALLDNASVTPITDGIERPLTERPLLGDGKAIYRGLRPGSPVRIFTSDGLLSGTVHADATGTAIVDYSQLPSRHVYILRSERSSIKIIK